MTDGGPGIPHDDESMERYRVALPAGTRAAAHPVRDDVRLLDNDFNADPLPAFTWMREHAPVYWDDHTGLWGVAGHADVMAVEADWETFSSAAGSRPESYTPSMINHDPPAHTARRRIISSGFTPRRVRRHEDFLRMIVTGLLDEVIESGRCEFVADVATTIPLRMIATLMDLPESDYDRLVRWSDLFASGDQDLRDEVVEAAFDYATYIVAILEDRRDGNADDLISLLTRAQPLGAPLSTEDLIHETMLILVGGDETTRHVMSGGLAQLMAHPDQLDRLRADRSLLPGAIEEMLRWVTPVRNMNRTATRDTTLGDQSILEGDRLLLLYLSANRDEAVFDQPERFDIERDPNLHVAFGGHGRHYCLGAQLARLELSVLFEQVLDRLHDLAPSADARPVERRGNFVLGLERLPVTFRPGERVA